MISKVFIIDDDDISIFLTSLVLEEAGFAEEIKTYNSADAALKDLPALVDNEIPPEVILLDLNMPGKSGWDFLDILRHCEKKLLGSTSVFILTSSIAASDKDHSRRYPLVRGFLHKPLTEESMAFMQKMHHASRS